MSNTTTVNDANQSKDEARIFWSNVVPWFMAAGAFAIAALTVSSCQHNEIERNNFRLIQGSMHSIDDLDKRIQRIENALGK